MAYATIDDVRNAAPQMRFSSDSRPSEAEVSLIISRVEAELDIIIRSLGFDTPIVTPLSLLIVRGMVINETLARALEQQYLGVTDPKSFGSDTFHQRYKDAIRSLTDPNDPFTLPDATKLNVQEKLEGEVGSISAEIGTDDEDYRLTRNMVF